jgi:hypothetical protein
MPSRAPDLARTLTWRGFVIRANTCKQSARIANPREYPTCQSMPSRVHVFLLCAFQIVAIRHCEPAKQSRFSVISSCLIFFALQMLILFTAGLQILQDGHLTINFVLSPTCTIFAPLFNGYCNGKQKIEITDRDSDV